MRERGKIIIDPNHVEFKVSPDADLRGIVGGDWDLVRRISLEHAAKHVAIRQRFLEGRRWEDTDLFQDLYAARIGSGDKVRGRVTMDELIHDYYKRVDGLYESMKQNGFLHVIDKKWAVPLPRVAIGRGGEIFLTNQGNHRLAIAKVLKMTKLPCVVQCRHEKWIDVRKDFAGHPDGSVSD